MEEEKIQQFLINVRKEKIRKKSYSGGDYYDYDVIDKDGFAIFETMLRSFLLENRDEKTGILEAKVFMYEQIISKSNFSPMLNDK